MPLTIIVPDREFYDPIKERFINIKGQKLSLEHSLVSITKWESKWHKPYLNKNKKTAEESLDYLRCMCITQDVNPLIFRGLDAAIIQEITSYINDPMTATKLRKMVTKPNREIITNELIYYWMVEFGIPFSPCEKWHLNRLMILIEIAARKNSPVKKRSKTAQAKEWAMLNAQRRAAIGTRG